MNRLATAAANFALGFLPAFVLASLIKNRRAGVKAGIALGLVLAGVSWVLYGKLDESALVEDVEEFDPEQPVQSAD